MDVLFTIGRDRTGFQGTQRGPGDPSDLPPTNARIEAHIFVAFLAYCLQVTLKQRLRSLAPGLTPRSMLDKMAAIQMVDVHLPTHGRPHHALLYVIRNPSLTNCSCSGG